MNFYEQLNTRLCILVCKEYLMLKFCEIIAKNNLFMRFEYPS